jgi:hypothetical protein
VTLALLAALVAAPFAEPSRLEPGEVSLLEGPSVAPRTQGAFALEGSRLVQSPMPGDYWLVPRAEGLDASGTLRVLFADAGQGPLAVVFGAGIDRRGQMHGWALRLVDRWMHLVRVDGGELTKVTDTVLVPKRAWRQSLELRVTTYGATVVAVLSDGATGETLAISSAEGFTPAGDLSGLAVLDPDEVTPGDESRARRGGPPVQELAYRPACLDTPPGVDAGPPVLVTVPREQAFVARGSGLELDPAGDDARLFRVGPLGLERLYCDGVAFSQVTTDLPWKYQDLVYWLSAGHPSLTAAPRLHGDTYKDGAMVEAELHALAQRYPRTSRLEILGVSHQGRPILALAVGAHARDGDAPSLLLTGGTHADEQLSTEIVLDAAATLLEAGERGGPDAAIARDLVTWCVPLVNPDGLVAYLEQSERAGRKNGRDVDGDGVRGVLEGVDINRNFPAGWDAPCELCGQPASRLYRGPAPGSEPETRAIMTLAAREHPLAAIVYHVGDVAVLSPYSNSTLTSPVPDAASLVADELAAAMPPHPEDRAWVVRHGLPATQGTDQDWLRLAFGTASYLIESCAWPSPLAPGARERWVAALRPSWEALAGRVLRGPTLSVHVRRAAGRPVVSEVRLLGLRTSAGERWTSRARDGRFDHVLARPGRWALEVDGGAAGRWVGAVTAGPGITEVEVPLGGEQVQARR